MSFSMVESTPPLVDVVKRELPHCTQNERSFLQRGRVIANEELTRGTISRAFSISELANGRIDVGKDILIGTTSLGILDIKTNNSEQSSKIWNNLPSLSPDIHSCNIQLEINTTGLTEVEKAIDVFVLKVTKNVEIGGELLLWFSEEILAIIDMPFLTPKNITGHKKYSCHICNETFEYPNPLKIHLFLSCERESMSQLWPKIAKTLWKQNYIFKQPGTVRSIDQCSSEGDRPNSVNTLPVSVKIEQNLRCISEPPISAFLPYKKNLINYEKLDIHKKQKYDVPISNVQPLNLTTSQSPINTNVQQPWINNLLELRLSRSLEELSSSYAADVELFASNWGKMKQGHLCVYCGKVYSRKYGLKIHIRTHTGYKPLKCKFCQRPFGDPSNLNKHVRLHASGLTPYMCSLCGKVLVRRRDLDRHMKSQHSGEDNCSSDDNIDIDD